MKVPFIENRLNNSSFVITYINIHYNQKKSVTLKVGYGTYTNDSCCNHYDRCWQAPCCSHLLKETLTDNYILRGKRIGNF